jgi:hypothetical protein
LYILADASNELGRHAAVFRHTPFAGGSGHCKFHSFRVQGRQFGELERRPELNDVALALRGEIALYLVFQI